MLGRLGGSSVDIVPWKSACAGSPSCSATAVLSDPFSSLELRDGVELLLFLSAGTQVKLALLKPPISESHMIFVAPMLSFLSKYMSGKGLVGTCRPFFAQECVSPYSMTMTLCGSWRNVPPC